MLHGHDLTFSICVGTKVVPEEFAGVLGSHLWLMRGVTAGLSSLGIVAEIGDNPRGKSRDSKATACFEHVAECDIRSPGGEKLAGAAQMRKSGALMEQVSMPVERNSVSYVDVFRGSSRSDTSGIAGIAMEDTKSALINGFAVALNVMFDVCDLSEREKIEADNLVRSKYESADWTAGKIAH